MAAPQWQPGFGPALPAQGQQAASSVVRCDRRGEELNLKNWTSPTTSSACVHVLHGTPTPIGASAWRSGLHSSGREARVTASQRRSSATQRCDIPAPGGSRHEWLVLSSIAFESLKRPFGPFLTGADHVGGAVELMCTTGVDRYLDQQIGRVGSQHAARDTGLHRIE